jgi:MarC family membrane protein
MDSGFLSAALLLFLVLDPFGNTPLFAALLREVPVGYRWQVVLRESLIAYCVLLVFLFFGQRLLGWLQLSQTSLGIAGAVVLFLIALRMIFPSENGVFGLAEEGEPLVVPLAVPAIAGPSAMTMVMLLASREPDRIGAWTAALTLAITLSTLILIAAARLIEVLGDRVMTALGRLMGFVLSILAVEMFLQGLRDFMRTL